MRDILFRGFCKCYKDPECILVNDEIMQGKWIYGSYVKYKSKFGDYVNHLIVPETGTEDTDDVCPETVGQFTGFTDINGKKIFEGDIVISPSYPYRSLVKFELGYWGGWVIENSQTRECTHIYEYEEYEVVGSIYDIPEKEV